MIVDMIIDSVGIFLTLVVCGAILLFCLSPFILWHWIQNDFKPADARLTWLTHYPTKVTPLMAAAQYERGMMDGFGIIPADVDGETMMVMKL